MLLLSWLSVALKVRLSVTVIRYKAGKNSLTALHKSNAPLVMALCGSKGKVIFDSYNISGTRRARPLSPPSTSPMLLSSWLSVALKVRLSVTVIT
jgi:hypothetical protein